MTDVMDIVWNSKVVTGEEKAKKPDMIAFRNSAKAINMLNKHIKNSKNIAIHGDVDMDGIGSTYILGRYMKTQTNIEPLYIINKEKVHGVQQKHVDALKDRNLDLLVIVDSSSNEIEIIKQFKCDVLVIDHHELDHSDLIGKTNDGLHDYVIVNNTISNTEIDEINCLIGKTSDEAADKLGVYEADDRMSCGLVVYELLRLYSEAYQTGTLLENLRLFQWAGVTLFTDAILLNTERNQWYIENTVHSMETEDTLKSLLGCLNSFKYSLDKSVINYTIAPVVNKAIRAGHSGDALYTVMFNPENIVNLVQYKEQQENAVKVGIEDARILSTYITRDLSDTNIHKNYNGVIAGRLCGDYNKNTVVYKVQDRYAEGSFRGRMSSIDYRNFIDRYSDETWASGHKTAFGFRGPVEKLDAMLTEMANIESNMLQGYLLTAGKLNDSEPGKFIIDDMDDFKMQGGIWRLGIGNSKVSTDEQIMITVSSSDIVLKETKGKLYIYDVLGLECKAFDIVTKPVVNIYVEYSKQIECYIK